MNCTNCKALAPSIQTELTSMVNEMMRLYGYPTDLPSRMRKLGEEFGEIAEAIARGDMSAVGEEGADGMIVLWTILIKAGYNPLGAMAVKLDRKIAEGVAK